MTKLQAWDTPSDYGGYNPVGHLGVMARHRDSGILDNVNWDVARERLAKAAGLDELPAFDGDWDSNGDDAPVVYDWRAGHWAVGWVEYLMVRPDAPEAVLNEAAQIVADIANYPILDEDRYSQAESDAVDAYWKAESVKYRLHYIEQANNRGAGISAFAARHDSPPSDDNGILFDILREDL